MKTLNSKKEIQGEKLMNELVEFAKSSLNPELCVEILLHSQLFKKFLYRKKEILDRINKEKIK